jgi:hypothetical protein
MEKYNVNPADYYHHLVNNGYPEFYPEEANTETSQKESEFRQGDVVYDQANESIAIVLGTIDLSGGELRLDSDGMQPIANLRPATLEDFQQCQYRTTEMHRKLFLECCSQAGVAPVRFKVKATIKKNLLVFVPLQEGMDEDEILEVGREMAHSNFNPNCDGNEESYTEDSSFLGSGIFGNLFD